MSSCYSICEADKSKDGHMQVQINFEMNRVMFLAYDEQGYWRTEFAMKDYLQACLTSDDPWIMRLSVDDKIALVDRWNTMIQNLPKGSWGYKSDLGELSQKLPGMDMKVKHPSSLTKDRCTEKVNGTLWTMVQHLNDSHKWTREAIADWVETLDPVPTFEGVA